MASAALSQREEFKVKYWSEAEVEFLREHVFLLKPEGVAAELGRTVNAVRVKCYELKLKWQGLQVRLPLDDDAKQFIRENYVTMTDRQFSIVLLVSRTQVRHFIRSAGLKLPDDVKKQRVDSTRFKIGELVWNKGLKLQMPPNAGQYVKGSKPVNSLYDGAIVVRKRKTHSKEVYKFIRVAPGKWKLLHRYVWEQANGPVAKGMLVTFKDGDTLNCAIENLCLISWADNARRNKRPMKDYDSDRRYAKKLFGSHWKRGLKEHPELVELKRLEVISKRTIRKVKKNANTK